MKKFKVGDNVRVKSNSRLAGGKYAGSQGVVVMITVSSKHPYRVQFDGDERCIFHAVELEEVKQ